MLNSQCVICGEPAAADVSEKPERDLWVCARHIYPPYRVELYLAIEAVKLAVRDLFAGPLGRLSRWAERLSNVRF